ncbi:ankyrin repeat domain-containing protein [Azotosporobacter soli]|uniref:ankyrin repeat domain-containing protein n=1 Tax=Azotosporobacter soli TaxID=3055040 RepID=UPI0031FF1B44
MMKMVLRWVLCAMICSFSLQAMAMSQDDAKAEMAKRNLNFTEQDFFKQCISGNAQTVQLYIDAGMNLEAKNAAGGTALMMAVTANKVENAKALINAGADVNAKDFQNATPLFFAVSMANKPLVEELINKGADPEVKTNYGFTAKKMANMTKNEGILELLNRGSYKKENAALALIDPLIPADYPTIKTKTSLRMLSENTLKEAKAEIGKVDSFQREVNRYGYLLGSKGYNDFGGKFWFGIAGGKTDIEYTLITPYSAVRYEFWRANKQFKPVDQAALDYYMNHRDTVCLVISPKNAANENFWERYNGYSAHKYEATISNVVIRKNGEVFQNVLRNGDKWYFPIDLFVGSEDMEVIAVDADNEQKILKVSADRIAEIK